MDENEKKEQEAGAVVENSGKAENEEAAGEAVVMTVSEENGAPEELPEQEQVRSDKDVALEDASGEEQTSEDVPTEMNTDTVTEVEDTGENKHVKSKKKKKESVEDGDSEPVVKPEHPEAAIEAILFATGNSVKVDRLAEILGMTVKEVRDSAIILKAQYEREDRGITIMELDDALQLGTKGEYYSYLMKLTKSSKQYSLSDTVIETLSIIAYKQPVTRSQIEQIRGVSCDHALNKLLEYDLIEEVGRLDAPGKPLLFGTTEQFLRSFGVKSLGDLPTLSPELQEDFKFQAEAEAAENLKVDV